MKRLVISGLILLLMFGLVGCGQETENDSPKKTSSKPKVSHSEILMPEMDPPDQDTPSGETISEDLAAALANQNQYAEITEAKMVKSLTGENAYTATFTVLAASKYADWTYEAKMKYTKYDQGWMVDEVDWVSGKYERVRLPDAETMAEDAKIYLTTNDKLYSYWNWRWEFMLPMENPKISYGYNADVGEEVLELAWYANEPLMHAHIPYHFTTLWQYDAQMDGWTLIPNDAPGELDYYIDYDYDVVIGNRNLNFTGEWYAARPSVYVNLGCLDTIIISNFTWEAFDIYVPALNQYVDISTHFEYSGMYSSDEYVMNKDRDRFTNENGDYIDFIYHDKLTTILLRLQDGTFAAVADVQVNLPLL